MALQAEESTTVPNLALNSIVGPAFKEVCRALSLFRPVAEINMYPRDPRNKLTAFL